MSLSSSYQSIFEQLPQAAIVAQVTLDHEELKDVHYISANAEADRIIGVSMAGRHSTALSDDPLKQLYSIFVRAVTAGSTERYELPVDPYGRYYQIQVFRLNGTCPGLIAILYDDITEAVNARTLQQALLEDQVKYQALFERMDEGYCIIQMLYDDKGKVNDWLYIEVNPAFERHNGLMDATGRTIREIAPRIEQKWMDIYDRVAVTGESIRFQEDSVALGRTFDLYAFSIGQPEERKVAVLFTNITQRKALEEQLREVELEKQIRRLAEQKQQEIVRASLTSVEEERHRIAESLHNSLGQLLYGVKISLAGLDQQQTGPEFTKAKNHISQLLTEAIRESRRISHDLMPATLEEFGLRSAVQDIGEQLGGSVKFVCQVKAQGRRLEKYLEMAIYRTVQELMTNIVKHAHAKTARVDIAIDDQLIKISVKDDGNGVSANKRERPGIGLASIRSKVRLLNGLVEISSVPGRGTTVDIRIPVLAQ